MHAFQRAPRAILCIRAPAAPQRGRTLSKVARHREPASDARLPARGAARACEGARGAPGAAWCRGRVLGCGAELPPASIALLCAAGDVPPARLRAASPKGGPGASGGARGCPPWMIEPAERCPHPEVDRLRVLCGAPDRTTARGGANCSTLNTLPTAAALIPVRLVRIAYPLRCSNCAAACTVQPPKEGGGAIGPSVPQPHEVAARVASPPGGSVRKVRRVANLLALRGSETRRDRRGISPRSPECKRLAACMSRTPPFACARCPLVSTLRLDRRNSRTG